ncbi:DUF4149 domain-containing protein [Snodgrassella sp. CFCC 13594]|uniref:DUF4149 domain-containing protein n=1 Tax=Snodgrassella sp. CFCC 13594 TaxID=1775559 RepID=UPI000834A1B7|nr:DUF4149 domain-containing protein [Snodgrassella sp. CFCC 13594]
MQRCVAILIGLWLGMQLTVGYVVAPVLFAALPKMVAGNIAGSLFGIVGYAGLIVWFMAILLGRRLQERSFLPSRTIAWMVVLWCLLAVSQWLVTPVIVALKTGSQQWLLSLLGGSFGLWHGLSSSIYLATS